ncbi:hypothetical protein [Nonomuraea aurantiaca]|uniref:hypothetical protein n=1 Tax=Nonomuraea aurantiaca TaxID=2878562 RepID=UPI001CD937F7|nr:hypothetical protein [Nonomuraea aurantiaca]MCA2229438.1 hypothetical protein [Nonomuraea aurantiaca]
MPVRWWRAMPALAARRVPVITFAEDAIADRAARMARFAAGARQVIARVVAAGVLLAAGWLLAVLFGLLSAAPAAADSTAATGTATAAGTSHTVTGSITDGFPTADGKVSASDNAEAMAGRTVDGLNSQSDPGLPPASPATDILDTNGLVPNGGGSGPFGPSMGDIARSFFDPRIEARRAPLASVLPPVVRTAADDPSFSPD